MKPESELRHILVRVCRETEMLLARLLPHLTLQVSARPFQHIEPHTGKLVLTICVGIQGGVTAEVLGQYIPFTVGSSTGFTLPTLRGWLLARIPESDEFTVNQVVLDASGVDLEPQGIPYRYLGVGEAEHQVPGFSTSPLRQKCREYGIERLLFAGSLVSGPSLAMINSVANAVSKWRPQNVLDLYSGTGALSLVAIKHGARTVVSVDVAPPDTVETTTPDAHWEYRTANASEILSLVPDYELVIADPFYSQTLACAKAITNLELQPRRLVLNAGRACQASAIGRVRAELDRAGYEIVHHQSHGELVFLCSL